MKTRIVLILCVLAMAGCSHKNAAELPKCDPPNVREHYEGMDVCTPPDEVSNAPIHWPNGCITSLTGKGTRCPASAINWSATGEQGPITITPTPNDDPTTIGKITAKQANTVTLCCETGFQAVPVNEYHEVRTIIGMIDHWVMGQLICLVIVAVFLNNALRKLW